MPENNSAPDSSTEPRRAAVVINPAKSVGSALKGAIYRLCETQGWAEPLWLETTVEDPGVGQAREALEAGVDVVIAAGGDGADRGYRSCDPRHGPKRCRTCKYQPILPL